MKKVFALSILLAFVSVNTLPAFASVSISPVIENGGDDKVKKKSDKKQTRKGQCYKVTSNKKKSTCCSESSSASVKYKQDKAKKDEKK